MSRSGYSDDIWEDGNAGWLYRGTVDRALQGRRGQAFLQEMLEAMAALPEPKLVWGDLQDAAGACCAIGSVGRKRGLDMSNLDPEDAKSVAQVFGIAECMAREIVYQNDAEYRAGNETPEQRFERMRRWIESELYDKSARTEQLREKT